MTYPNVRGGLPECLGLCYEGCSFFLALGNYSGSPIVERVRNLELGFLGDANMRKVLICETLALLAMLCGCVTTNQVKAPKEPALEEATTKKPELTSEAIKLVEEDDTSGTVAAAREAADKLISDAQKIYSVKEKEAEAHAAEIIANAKKKAVEQAKATLKAQIEEMKAKTESETKAKADKILSNADKKADAILRKALADAAKIKATVIASAEKAAADITAKAGKDSVAAKRKAIEQAKKQAKDYLAKKRAETDKTLAEIAKDAKKNSGLVRDGKSDKYIGTAIVARALLDNILKGMAAADYKVFTKDFTKEHKQVLTKKKFDTSIPQLNKKLGTCSTHTYLGRLQKGMVTIYIWKGNFSNLKNNELLLELALIELDGKYKVFAFNVSPL